MQRSTEQLTRRSTETLEEEPVDNKTGNEKSDSPENVENFVPEKIMAICRSTLRWFLLVDLILALSVLVLVALLEFGIIPERQIGFFCNDPKISHKFTGDTISVALLLVGSVIIPLALMFIVEYACHDCDSYDTLSSYAGSRGRQIWTWYGHYFIGFFTLIFVCDIMKILIGEPRPHFLDTCRPREAINCTNQYVERYTCTNSIDSQWFVSDSSKSFPSGHSALSVYTALFTVWYLKNRLPSRMFILKPWLQCIVCLWGVTCSLTRIGDKRHHWWDVLAGDALGIAFCVYVIAVPCRLFYLDSNGPSSGRTYNDATTENGRIVYDDKSHKNVKKLLTSAGIEIPEGRELKDISTTWKE